MLAKNTFLICLTAFLAVFALSSWTGKVVSVTDGDTIKVMHEGKAVKIRLYGIDAPEKKQPWGNKSKQFTSNLAFNKKVTVHPVSSDRYGRTIARITLPDGKDLGQELVRNGLAWWYRQYAMKDDILPSLESEARSKGRGLWSDMDPVAPWDWRRLAKERK
jgi:micrococcal nuclease